MRLFTIHAFAVVGSDFVVDSARMDSAAMGSDFVVHGASGDAAAVGSNVVVDSDSVDDGAEVVFGLAVLVIVVLPAAFGTNILFVCAAVFVLPRLLVFF